MSARYSSRRISSSEVGPRPALLPALSLRDGFDEIVGREVRACRQSHASIAGRARPAGAREGCPSACRAAERPLRPRRDRDDGAMAPEPDVRRTALERANGLVAVLLLAPEPRSIAEAPRDVAQREAVERLVHRALARRSCTRITMSRSEAVAPRASMRKRVRHALARVPLVHPAHVREVVDVPARADHDEPRRDERAVAVTADVRVEGRRACGDRRGACTSGTSTSAGTGRPGCRRRRSRAGRRSR